MKIIMKIIITISFESYDDFAKKTQVVAVLFMRYSSSANEISK